MATKAELKRRAEAYVEEYNAEVAAMFGLDPVDIQVIMNSNAVPGEAVVAGGPGQVLIDPTQWDPSNIGAVIFELTRSYGVDTDSARDVAKADAARYLILGPRRAARGDEGWTLSEPAQQIVDRVTERAAQEGKGPGQESLHSYTDEGRYMGEGNATTGEGFGTPPPVTSDDDEKAKDKKEAAKRDRVNRRSLFSNMVGGWGIEITSDIAHLIRDGIQKGWDRNTFTFYLRQTDAYAETFRGIFNDDGSMKMTEGQYMEAESQFKDYATAAGINYRDNLTGWLIQNDVTPAEYGDRAEAKGRLDRDRELYQAFQKELVQGGIAKPNEVNRKEMLKYSLGMGQKAWYDLWQDTVTRNSAEQAGIHIGQRDSYTALGQGQMERISGKDMSEDEMDANWLKASEGMTTVLPMSEAKTYGVSKRDIIAAAFGGKNSAKARMKIKRATETYEASTLDRASAQFFKDQSGEATALGMDTQTRAQSY